MKTKLFNDLSLVSLGLFAYVALGLPILRGDVSTSGLEETREFSDEGVDHIIRYTDDTDPTNDHRITAGDVDDIEGWLETSYDVLVGDMGFRPPWLASLPEHNVVVRDIWWKAEPDCIVLHAPSIRDWPEAASRVVTLHERFHSVQRNYKDSINGGGSGYIGSTFGKLVSEGTADAMMDRGYADVDDLSGFPYYDGSAENFLRRWWHTDDEEWRDGPRQCLFDKDYDGCLWWNYLMEQLGTNKTEPNYGSEFMRTFWERLVASGDTGKANSKEVMESLIASRGSSFEEIFHDFTICNYVREFDATALAKGDRYTYVDEQTLALGVSVDKNTTSVTGSGSTTVKPWSTFYTEATVSRQDECLAVGFKAESDGDNVAISVVAIDRDDKVIGIKKGRASEYAGVFFSTPDRPIARICGIVAGLEEEVQVDWDFDAGVPKLEIKRPTFTRPAYPGPFDEPGNVVIKTKVTGLPDLAPDGPNTPSILGLEADYFGVQIGGIPAMVLDAAYVGGLWELLVEAPVQPADGLYDVRVSLCPDLPGGGIQDSQTAAVLYGAIVFHHAIVLDVSGSMEYPDTAKLDAAKQAAKFYIDTVGNKDRFTVVSFTGEGTECNDDATNLKGSPGLFPGNNFSRDLMKLAVDLQSSQDRTSIGDGLWIAQDALDNDALPNAIDTMLLLTDGKENESRYWDKDPDGCGSVKSRITMSRTIVNTRAFGESAETDLCQEIANVTLGDYLFVPVEEGVAARVAAPDFTSLNNRLTLEFLDGLEHTKKLQRIVLERVKLGGGESFTGVSPVNYDDVSEPLVYVGWSKPTTVEVAVTDPNNDDLKILSTVYQDSTHIVLHPNNPLIRGPYEFSIKELDGTPIELFYGISGKLGNRLNFYPSLSAVKNGGIGGRPEGPREFYEHGMPVDINLAMFDRRGPVRDADVTARVIMPDGRKACSKNFVLNDDGGNQDGADDDGRYGFRYTRTPFASSYEATEVDRGEEAKAQPGSSGTYRVIIEARGKDNFGNEFERTFEESFQVYQRYESGNGDGDTDDDGIPDSWEIFYGTDPTVKDDTQDKDLDGLINREEFFHGTHPNDPDSDNGGAADGYEVTHNLCPICPRDDPFPSLANVSVITTTDSHGNAAILKPNSILLQFPDHPSYRQMEVYRDVLPNFVCNAGTLIEQVDMTEPGLITSYYDEGLVDGERYYYKLRAMSIDGTAGTPFSRELSGVAYSDPAEPLGAIVINGGFGKSDRLRVAVKLLPQGNATEFRLAESPFRPTDTWRPLPRYGTIVPMNLTTAGLGDGDSAKVYFEFRSPGGTSSRVNHVDILLDFSGNNDSDGLPNAADPDDDNDGVPDLEELFVYSTDPYSADTDGDGYSDSEEIARASAPRDSGSRPDTDGDGYDDRLEDLLGSDLGDAASVPDINLSIVEAGQNVEISFDTVSGVLYRIHERSDLTSRVRDWNVLAGPFAGDNTRQTRPAPKLEDISFYGVSFELAPLP